MNLSSRLSSILELEPAAIAIGFEGSTYSWSYIAKMRDEIDGYLRAQGLGRGTRVAITLRNRPQHVAAVTALLATQRCIVTINPFSGGAKVAEDIRSTQAPVVIADEQDWGVEEIRAAATSMGALCLCISSDRVYPIRPFDGRTQVSGDGLQRTNLDVAVEMLTSGTTGAPKRVELNYGSLNASVKEGLNPESTQGELKLKSSPAIVYSPLVHIGGMFGIVLAFYEPRPIALLEKFELNKWLDLVRRYRPKFASLVPATIRMILDANVAPEDLVSLIAVRAGTAPLDQLSQRTFEDRYGVPVLVTYGATEFAGAVTRWTLEEYKKHRDIKRGSVGRVRQGFELRVVDRNKGFELAAGDIGVLEIKAPRLSGETWIRTTDLAAIDAEGFLFIHGRADEAINRGGFKVLPEVVANVFRQHPAVQDVVVVALEDSKLGQVPGLAVELRPNFQLSEAALRSFAREHLISYQVPARYLILDELPRTAAMKVRLVEVHEMFQSAVPAQ